MKPFSEMIKSELEAAAEAAGVVDAVREYAKNSAKPTNAEYVYVLEMDAAEKAGKVTIESVEDEDEKGTEDTDSETKLANKVEDLNTMIPVIVTDHDNSIDVTEDEERRTIGLRWGNPMIGMTTTQVARHGKLQYLPKGAVIRLKKIPLADHIKDADGKEKSVLERRRFSVSDTTGWSEAEFEAHRKEQAMKRI